MRRDLVIRAKEASSRDERGPAEFSNAYSYLALARTQKLILSYHMGKRREAHTKAFIADLHARVVTIPEISTDGWQSHPVAIGQSFAGRSTMR